MADDKFADEILSDDELDAVAGGNYTETNQDLENFEAMGMKIYVQAPELTATYHYTLNNLINAFQKYGVKYDYDFGTRANRYFVDGKELNHEEVWSYIKSQSGK